MNTSPLTIQDIQKLKRQRNFGILIGIIAFIIITGANFLLNYVGIIYKGITEILAVFVFILIFRMMSLKYSEDIANKVAVIKEKKISRKLIKTEAGITAKHFLVLDNVRYLVDKELFQRSKTNDMILMYYAPKSDYLIKIELK